jgi:hypothetical protein
VVILEGTYALHENVRYLLDFKVRIQRVLFLHETAFSFFFFFFFYFLNTEAMVLVVRKVMRGRSVSQAEFTSIS